MWRSSRRLRRWALWAWARCGQAWAWAWSQLQSAWWGLLLSRVTGLGVLPCLCLCVRKTRAGAGVKQIVCVWRPAFAAYPLVASLATGGGRRAAWLQGAGAPVSLLAAAGFSAVQLQNRYSARHACDTLANQDVVSATSLCTMCGLVYPDPRPRDTDTTSWTALSWAESFVRGGEGGPPRVHESAQ